MSFFRRHVDEIADDPALRWYGGALALVNAVAALQWILVTPLNQVLDPRAAPICWPFLSDCHVFRVLGPEALSVLVVAFFILAIANTALFMEQRFVPVGYWCLLAMSVVKAGVILQDYRLILNHHYMAFWITIPFLLVPEKRRTLPALLVSMYLWAGVLKVRPGSDWLTGAAFYGRRPLGLPASLIPAECAYVVVLELVIVFGLLARRGWVFWSSFVQFLLFHLASFWVVGFFYPIQMFLLLAVFPLRRFWPTPSRVMTLSSARWPRPASLATVATVGGLCVAQLILYGFPGDSTTTGEGRMFALNMFDAPVECRATAVFEHEGLAVGSKPIRPPFLNTRIWCDPIVYLSAAQTYCREHAASSGLGDMKLVLESRKHGEERFRTIVSIGSFCVAKPRYDVWRHNSWIHDRE